MAATQAGGLKSFICVGEIAAPHGVQGGLRVRSFTSPPARLFSYELQDEGGAPVALMQRGADPKPEMFIAEIAGVKSREGAEALRGRRLFTARTALPAPAAGEYYLSDLIGLRVRDANGENMGRIFAVHNFGAGEILEIKDGRQSLMLPFDDDCVPQVDLANGLVIVALPVEVSGEPGHGGGADDV